MRVRVVQVLDIENPHNKLWSILVKGKKSKKWFPIAIEGKVFETATKETAINVAKIFQESFSNAA